VVAVFSHFGGTHAASASGSDNLRAANQHPSFIAQRDDEAVAENLEEAAVPGDRRQSSGDGRTTWTPTLTGGPWAGEIRGGRGRGRIARRG